MASVKTATTIETLAQAANPLTFLVGVFGDEDEEEQPSGTRDNSGTGPSHDEGPPKGGNSRKGEGKRQTAEPK